MVPGMTHLLVKKFGTVFEKYIRDARTDRYNIIYYIEEHKKNIHDMLMTVSVAVAIKYR